MSHLYDDAIALMAMDLGVGDRSGHLRCPSCKHPSNTFVIYADADGLGYQCYRNSCGLRGKVGGVVQYVAKKKRAVKAGWELLNPEPPPPDVEEYLCNRFYLSPDDLWLHGVMWDERSERVLLPITGLPRGRSLEGYLARCYPELEMRQHGYRSKAQAIFQPTTSMAPFTCLMKPRGTVFDTLVVAEDYWSALRINQHTPACALSGTSVGHGAITAILKAGVKRLLFVLDADAVAKARKLAYDYTLLFQHIGYIPLYGADPKDMCPAELQEHVIVPIKETFK